MNTLIVLIAIAVAFFLVYVFFIQKKKHTEYEGVVKKVTSLSTHKAYVVFTDGTEFLLSGSSEQIKQLKQAENNAPIVTVKNRWIVTIKTL